MKDFHFDQFNLERLIKLKRKKGLKIGVALPVLNEEKTIRGVIDAVRDCRDLVDDLIVIDSGSKDGSIRVCKQKTVTVIRDSAAAKDLGIPLHRGKGFNLWASLYYLDTDIVLWIDTDISNISKRFIIGLAGPLITDDQLKFVKGYYHRPKNDSRVTEILVRPFLNAVFPGLKHFFQPLSGEYAGRKVFLERVWFCSGYSVEVAVLLQAYNMLTSKQLAQVFLGKRIHELQTVASLGRMASSILLTLLEFSKKFDKIYLKVKPRSVLYQFNSFNGKRFTLTRYKTVDVFLPPMGRLIKNYEKNRRTKSVS